MSADHLPWLLCDDETILTALDPGPGHIDQEKMDQKMTWPTQLPESVMGSIWVSTLLTAYTKHHLQTQGSSINHTMTLWNHSLFNGNNLSQLFLHNSKLISPLYFLGNSSLQQLRVIQIVLMLTPPRENLIYVHNI